MKKLALIVLLVFAGTASADSASDATLAEIQKTLGFVPAFVKAVPATLLPTWWRSAMAFEDNPATKLDGKTKQLIAVAVAAQIPCELCTYYHTEAARLAGATDEELREAVAMAATVRHNSTIANGMQIDKVQFRKDVDRMIKAARQAKK